MGLCVLVGATVCTSRALGQSTQPVDAPLQQMQAQLQAQQKEIEDLKSKLPIATTLPTASPSGIDAQIIAQGKQITALQNAMKQSAADASDSTPTYPTLQFHGFGDITYHANTLKGDHNSVTLGEFDFFLSSQLSPDMSVLSETVISADNTNFDGIEIERLMFTWNANDCFNVDVGRFHTHVGYYNTEYHHGTWFQVATNRPFIDMYEDSSGVIPAHTVGMSFYGKMPWVSDKLGMEYFAEWGNGHQYQSPTSSNSVVANVLDDNNYKAFNLAMIIRPEVVPGLQLGAGFYHDTLSLAGVKTTEELFYHAHAAYTNADWELMAEGYAINHTHSGLDAWSYAYFGQLSRKYGAFTPYARFTYFDGSNSDPFFALQDQTGRHYGPSAGVRWDFTTYAALKVQYDYFVNSQPGLSLTLPFQPIRAGGYSEIEVQLCFTY
jgi:hypothetical protein